MAERNASSAKSSGTDKNKQSGGLLSTASSLLSTSGGGQDAASLIKADHRKVEGLFKRYEDASDSGQKSKLAKQVCKELIIHAQVEEEIFYSACREKDVEEDLLDEAQIEHDSAKLLIGELIEGSPDDEFYDAKVKVLSEYIKHHVAEEEKPRTGILARAKSAGVDMNAVGQKILARKQELTGQLDENDLDPPQPKELHPEKVKPGREKSTMPRQSYGDERRRYARDDDDDYRGSGRERDGRGRFMSDDDRGSRGGNGGRGRERDDYGRFMSDDDDGGYRASGGGYRSRGRDDEDGDRGRSRGGHGWYGDSQGHSEASERGWENRSSSRGGYSSRGGRYEEDDDDRRSSPRGGGRGHGGWFGDPEGHSEASERGWEHRSSSRGGGDSRSRSRDDDDDRRSSSSRGRSHGGWFGDSRGHSEAARRGWEDR